MTWVKACNTHACVEVTVNATASLILVRDSKDPDGLILAFTPEEWDAFTDGVRRGVFNRENLEPLS